MPHNLKLFFWANEKLVIKLATSTCERTDADKVLHGRNPLYLISYELRRASTVNGAQSDRPRRTHRSVGRECGVNGLVRGGAIHAPARRCTGLSLASLRTKGNKYKYI